MIVDNDYKKARAYDRTLNLLSYLSGMHPDTDVNLKKISSDLFSFMRDANESISIGKFINVTLKKKVKE